MYIILQDLDLKVIICLKLVQGLLCFKGFPEIKVLEINAHCVYEYQVSASLRASTLVYAQSRCPKRDAICEGINPASCEAGYQSYKHGELQSSMSYTQTQ